jgi:hypothetical protein
MRKTSYAKRRAEGGRVLSDGVTMVPPSQGEPEALDDVDFADQPVKRRVSAEELSEAYLELMEETGVPISAVDQALADARQAAALRPAPERPEFESPSESGRNYSAPVSRDWVDPVSRDRPGKITLSVLEKEIADRAGISYVDYALGKADLQRRKRDGEI